MTAAQLGGLIVLRAIVYGGALAGGLVAYRWIDRRSAAAGALFAIGFIVRAVLGTALFLISLFRLPLFRGLQLGGGFWALAVDGRSYYDAAAWATIHGIGSVPAGSPSPAFVRALALWLELAGVAPVSAVLFNLLCYTLTALLIAASGRSIGQILALGAVTASPALIVFSTQPLKDPFCVLLIALAVAGMRLWTMSSGATRARRAAGAAAGATCLCLAVFLMAGVRAYFALFMVVAFVAAGASAVATGSRRWQTTLCYVSVLPLLWLLFAIGAGPYYESYRALLTKAVATPDAGVAALDTARARFVQAGGATSAVAPTAAEPGAGTASGVARSVAAPAAREPGAEATAAPRERADDLIARAAQTARGVLLLFVPISLLKSLSLVTFPGGRGLLPVTDVDTLVIDLTLAAAITMAIRRCRFHTTPVAVFIVVLAGVTSLTMSYVVTNFGTLFRLRLLAVTPVWLLGAFAVPSEAEPGSEPRVSPT